jgi:tyrosyl-tRNA synthetase
MSGLFDDLQWRGLVHQVTDDDVAKLLDNDSLAFYHGVDPSADSLGMHHLVGLLTLRRLATAGHPPVALVGGGTGLIGDPSGKTEERTLLSAERLAANVAGVTAQVERIVGPGVLVVNNADWLGALTVPEFLRDVGKHFSVNEMIRKESVRARLEGREQGISYTEFSYMLLQAYDFLHLFRANDCRLQIGGSDQWGNIIEGVDLIRRLESGTAYGLTWPLVTKADGTKFGKTEGGTVWLDPAKTSPYQFRQFWMGVEDSQVERFLLQLTFLSVAEVAEVVAAHQGDPGKREAQRVLAREVTTIVHGDSAHRQAAAAADVLFYGGDPKAATAETLAAIGSEVPTTSAPLAELDMGGLLVLTGLASSRGDARRGLEQRAFSINGEKVGPDVELADIVPLQGRYLLLAKGRKTFHLVTAV